MNSIPTVPEVSPRSVLVVDIGGTHVKILVSGKRKCRSADSGPLLTPEGVVAMVQELAGDWQYDAISIGYPGPVAEDRPTLDPKNLGPGWRDFDFAAAFERPVKVVNDALLQAVGSYEGGRMLFLGLGTGLGSALVLDGLAHPLELAHLPYRKGRTFEDYVGKRGLLRIGKRKWRRRVCDMAERLRAALLVDDVVIGGGNVANLHALPAGVRRGSNDYAFVGGYRLWDATGLRLGPERGSRRREVPARPHGQSLPAAARSRNHSNLP
ncbi:MAG: ROK family protein [Gemmatimonadetes bacterium]|nr:ROK family protein [Gemmatimonadota bacterium]